MIRASIDIGSNTILLLIADVNGNEIKEFENESRVTSLGRSLDEAKKFSDQGIKDSYDALKDYSEIIRKYEISPDQVIMTATEASRVAENSSEFFEKVKKDFGFEVKIISADAEAYYVSLGVVRGSNIDKAVNEIILMDIGGASTELVKIRVSPFKVQKTISLGIGSVRCTDWLNQNTFEEKMEKVLSDPTLESFKTDYLLCVAGSMTSLGGMIKGLSEFDSDKINGAEIDFSKFKKFVSKISDIEAPELLRQYPFLGKRSQSIKAGALLGLKVGEFLGVEHFEISTLGLRYGTILEGEIKEEYVYRA